MNRIFVDANHLVALSNPNDQLHVKAAKAEVENVDRDLVTTEDVLVELLNFYCEQGEFARRRVAAFVRELLLDVRVEVVAHSEPTFLNGLELYESRPDKGYSLTDCISMNVCRQLGIDEILSSDKHFAQEGFTVLL